MTLILIYFVLSIIASSIGILLILLVKKGLEKHISSRWQYRLDLLFFVLLVMPFIPGSFFASLNMRDWLNIPRPEGKTVTNMAVSSAEETELVFNMGWLQDFAVTVDYSTPEFLTMALVGIWIIGILVFMAIMMVCSQKLRLIKESLELIDDEEMLCLFSRCKAEIGVKGSILLGSSVLVRSPITFGYLKTYIILPAEKILLNDARYAMMHELLHCKNKDTIINGIMCLFQILYWFNPLIYLAFKQMRLDRELACDASVLEMLPEELRIDYGKTLLNFSNALSRSSMNFFAAALGGSKPQIIKRVEHIASYTSESGLLKAKGICAFAFMVLIIFCQLPILSAFASDDGKFHFHHENVLYQDLSSYFDGFEGSFVLYDLNDDLYTIHNKDMSVTRVSPTSTYKIFSALIALEAGVLEGNSTLGAWDGTLYPFEAWNQDHYLASAMQYSVNWYFQNLDAQVGIEALRFYLNQLSYGNQNLSGGIANFWIESSLRISPLEQVGLLRDFYQDNTAFETKHVNAVKDALRLYESNGSELSGKTGSGFINYKDMSGLFIGYVESDGGMFIFATYVRGEEAGGSTAVEITISILEDKGIF